MGRDTASIIRAASGVLSDAEKATEALTILRDLIRINEGSRLGLCDDAEDGGPFASAELQDVLERARVAVGALDGGEREASHE